MKSLSLSVLPERLAICRLSPDEPIPELLAHTPFWSATRTDEELSIVVPEEAVPACWKAERGWRCLKVLGLFDFSLTGILASVAVPLDRAGVSIFAISTHNTDYILVKDSDLRRAKRVLVASGHSVNGKHM
jgi:hypothetical protein